MVRVTSLTCTATGNTMRIFALTSLDNSADSNGTSATSVNSANQDGTIPPDATNGVGIDWQTLDIPPYQSAAAAMTPFTLSVSDPVAAGGWLTQAAQTPQSSIDGWLTQTMQTGGAASLTWGAGSAIGAAPGNGDYISGAAAVTSLASPNPLQPPHSLSAGLP